MLHGVEVLGRRGFGGVWLAIVALVVHDRAGIVTVARLVGRGAGGAQRGGCRRLFRVRGAGGRGRERASLRVALEHHVDVDADDAAQRDTAEPHRQAAVLLQPRAGRARLLLELALGCGLRAGSVVRHCPARYRDPPSPSSHDAVLRAQSLNCFQYLAP